MESGLSDALIEKNSELKDLFEVKWVNMKRKLKKSKEEIADDIDEEPNSTEQVEEGFEMVERPVVR